MTEKNSSEIPKDCESWIACYQVVTDLCYDHMNIRKQWPSLPYTKEEVGLYLWASFGWYFKHKEMLRAEEKVWQ